MGGKKERSESTGSSTARSGDRRSGHANEGVKRNDDDSHRVTLDSLREETNTFGTHENTDSVV